MYFLGVQYSGSGSPPGKYDAQVDKARRHANFLWYSPKSYPYVSPGLHMAETSINVITETNGKYE